MLWPMGSRRVRHIHATELNFPVVTQNVLRTGKLFSSRQTRRLMPLLVTLQMRGDLWKALVSL